MTIIDSFIYYNEQELTELRLHELKDAVDHHVLAYGDITFRGNPNEYRFQIPEEFKSRVTLLEIKLPTNTDAWGRERYLREAVSSYIQNRFFPFCRVLFSDADEIVSAEALGRMDDDEAIYNFELDEYYYNFGYPHGTTSAPYSCLVEDLYNAEDIRYRHLRKINREEKHIDNAGWHLSCFGDAEFISNKLKNFSHAELDTPEWTEVSNIQRRIDGKIDIIERSGEHYAKEHTNALPQYVLNNKDKYKGWF
jgi:beta-1,4-mannosyl-glycoprotein beta-1,4-N-acetylglucosaminyltransferase